MGRAVPNATGLTTVRLTEANVERCEPLWGGRSDYTAPEVSALLDRVRWLLSTERARGAMFLEHDGRLRGFGLATFVHEDVITAFVAAPHPQFGRRVLSDPDFAAITLDETDIGRRNATGGVELVVLNQGYDLDGLTQSGGWQPLAGTSMQAFADAHRGYKLARIVNEIFDKEGVAFLERARPATIHRFASTTRSGERLLTGCWILSRQEAERHGGFILPMFAYSPPIIRFTATERRVLRFALSGATDEVVATLLRVPLTAVKARWRRIQDRATIVPGLGERIATLRRQHTRGLQWRHLIIEYVRTNPSELTPYLP
jgi:hypothetical protein